MTRGFRDYYGGYQAPQGQGDIVFATIAANSLPANTDWLFTVPAGERWQPLCLFAQLVTDVTAGNRALQLKISPQGGGVATYFAGIQAGPGAFFDVNWGPGFPIDAGVAATGIIRCHFPMPVGLLLLAGGTLGSNTAFVGPADVWNNLSPIGFLYQRWAGLQ